MPEACPARARPTGLARWLLNSSNCHIEAGIAKILGFKDRFRRGGILRPPCENFWGALVMWRALEILGSLGNPEVLASPGEALGNPETLGGLGEPWAALGSPPDLVLRASPGKT